MSTLTWVESKKMWFNTQTKEWWKICEVCKEAKHVAKYPRCMNCTIRGKNETVKEKIFCDYCDGKELCDYCGKTEYENR